LLGAALLAGCGQPQLAPLAPGDRVLAFGDSLTRGTGAGRDQGYPEHLARQTGLEVHNAGVPGETSDEGLRRLPALLQEIRPKLVILCHGGNDILQRQDPAQSRQNIEAMVRLARTAGSEVILLAVPTPGLWLDAAPIYGEIGEELGVPVDLDSIPELLRQPAMKSDQVHFNSRGYAELARRIQEQLRRYGALPR